MADTIELIVRFHPVAGEDVTLLTTDFGAPEGALPNKRQRCWKRPNFALIADFNSTDLSCNPRTPNCGTRIYVELAERTAG